MRMLGEIHTFVWQSYHVALSGNYAYVAPGQASGLRIVDLSNPAAPVETGYALNTDRCPGVATWMAGMVDVSGDYAYVLYYDGYWSSGYYRLYIYDVSNRGATRQTGWIALPNNCTGQCVKANYVYITAFSDDGLSGVEIIDVLDPMLPVEAGAFRTPGLPQGLCVVEGIAYIADDNALVIDDVSIPPSPHQLGSYAPEAVEYLVLEVAVRGDYVLVADPYFGIRILDASDFSAIREVGSYPQSEADVQYSPVRVSGDTAYFLRHGDDMDKELIVLDISDPSYPVELGLNDLPGYWWFYGFDYCNGYACVAGGSVRAPHSGFSPL